MAYLPILTYHRLLPDDPTPEADPRRISVGVRQFRQQLTWFKRLGYQSMPLKAFVAALRAGHSIPSKHFAITFDDGYRDNLTLGLPILRDVGFSAMVFAVSGELGGTNRWDDSKAPLMTVQELKEWRRAGMEVGAHTAGHAHLTRVTADVAQDEIEASRRSLEESLGETVSLFAYPYGENNEAVRGWVRGAGFEAAFATDRAPREQAEDFFQIRRVVVFPKNNLWEMTWKLQRWYPTYQDWKR